MTDIANNGPVTDIDAVARTFWNRGLKYFRARNSGSEITNDWPYIVSLLKMTATGRRDYWLASVDPDLDASAVEIFNAYDDVFERLEVIHRDAMARVPAPWIRRYLLRT